jgi:hypothetical protein
LVELILQAIIRQERILVTAPSNIAVDTILIRLSSALEDAIANKIVSNSSDMDRLVNAKRNLVRIGHPARIHPVTQMYSLDARIAMDEDTDIVRDVKKELDGLRSALSRGGRRQKNPASVTNSDGATIGNTKRELSAELKSVRKELQQREQAVVRRILQRSVVVFATCIGAASHLLTGTNFDLIIVDEAAQALEAATWIPILRAGHINAADAAFFDTPSARRLPTFADVGKRLGGKIVLAGDHCQLPPTVKSELAAEQGLSMTLFEHIVHFPQHGQSSGRVDSSELESEKSFFAEVVKMLNLQYRMHEVINHWASQAMYQGELLAHESVRHHSLLDLIVPHELKAIEDAEEVADCPPVMLFVDTSGTGMYEEADESSAAIMQSSGGSSSKAKDTSKIMRSSYSHRNMHEAVILVEHVARLLKRYPQSIQCRHIGLITPYNGQLQCLKSLVAEHPFLQSRRDIEDLEIKTVDGFQGGEKEIILFSFVRSNEDTGRVGFLKDSRRINVAVTRTKRHFVGVGDRRTIGADAFVRGLLDHIDNYGDVLSVEEFQQDGGDGLEGGKDGGCSLRSCRYPSEDVDFSQLSIAEETSQPHSAQRYLVGEKKKAKAVPRKESKSIISSASAGPSRSTKEEKSNGEDVVAQEQEKERIRKIIRQLFEAFVSKTVSLPALKEQCDTFTKNILQKNQSQIGSLVQIMDRGCALHFGSHLNSFQRMLLHEVADTILGDGGEKLLRHRSVGEGDSRYLEVWVVSTLARQLFQIRQESTTSIGEDTITSIAQEVIVSEIGQPSAENQEEEEEEEEVDGGDNDPAVAPSSSKKKNKQKNKNKTKATAAAPASAMPPTPPTNTIASLAAIAHLDRQRQKELRQAAEAKQQKQAQEALKKAATDDDFLDLLVTQNEKIADERKYRLGSARPMPNYDKEYAKDKLRAKLDASQQLRRVTLSEEEQQGKGSTSGKKVVKKPPPNFGGGKLGTK